MYYVNEKVLEAVVQAFCKKSVLRNFTKFTGKHLCHGLWYTCVGV